MTKRFLTELESYAALALLHAHATATEEGCRYQPEWDDARVTREAGLEGLESQVKALRRRTFGNLVAPEPVEPVDVMAELIAKHNALARALMPLDPSFLIGE